MLLSQWAVLGCAGLCFVLIGDPYISFASKSSGGQYHANIGCVGVLVGYTTPPGCSRLLLDLYMLVL